MGNCEKCGVSMFKRPLFRITPKGEDPHWMCEQCAISIGKKPDDDVVKISEIALLAGKRTE